MADAKPKTIHEAFAEAYADMSNPKKNATNPAFKSKYANLEELLAVTRPVLAALGFSLVQPPVNDGENIGVHTMLLHTSGERMDFGAYTVPLTKHDAQGAGSAITYCRRYAIAAVFGLAQEDDDGNAASAPSADYMATPRGAGGGKPATEKQVKAIWGKAKSLGCTKIGDVVAKVGKHPDEMTAAEASAALDALQTELDNPPDAPAPEDLDEPQPWPDAT